MERDENAFAAGAAAARADIAAGRLVYRWYGHSAHFGHWIVAQLEERFGVSVNEGFGVCLVNNLSISFDDGYNGVLSTEIDRRYGRGEFEAVIKQAREQTEEALWEAKEAWRARHP